jgi:hypothetical protein
MSSHTITCMALLYLASYFLKCVSAGVGLVVGGEFTDRNADSEGEMWSCEHSETKHRDLGVLPVVFGDSIEAATTGWMICECNRASSQVFCFSHIVNVSLEFE